MSLVPRRQPLAKKEPDAAEDLITSFGDSFGDWGLHTGIRVQTIVAQTPCEALFLKKDVYMKRIQNQRDIVHQQKLGFLRQVGIRLHVPC